jgi:transcriptional regulator with XRE-family HTH domain
MDVKKNFGKRIREIRTSLSLTQEQLAEKMGISPKSLSQIELGNNFISAEKLDLMCKALNVKPKVLFDFEYLESSKESFIDDVIERVKNNPEIMKALHKVIVALDS